MSLADQRMAICRECEHFNNIIKICKICNCFMPAKTLLQGSRCAAEPPKWLAVAAPESGNCCNHKEN